MNALTSGRPSEWTRIFLRRQDLLQISKADPEIAIRRLHELVAAGEATPEALFALAELSFLFARAKAPDGGNRAHYLASAVYAWALLFGEAERDEIARVDPRASLAAELYNHAIAAAFGTGDGKFEPRAGLHPLPFGTLDVSFDPEALEWGRRRLTELQPAAGLKVRGLRNRYRQPGIGAPLLATAVPREPWPEPDDLALAKIVVSATAVLALPEPRAQLRQTSLRGRLALYRGHESTSLDLVGRRVPLEIEPSVALAATLERSGVWRGRLSAFLGRAVGVERPARIFALKPLLPGQTPVVFVHGTNSDPSVWANMANDLLSDPKIRERFSFWFFAYDSGNPILYSGMMLRRVSTSLDNMSPGNIVIQTLVEIPIAPGVAQHSIVAVRGDGPPQEGDDGVVRFSSAHRPDADSELIVRSGHSTQSNPRTINEVARILGLHAEHSTCQRPASHRQGDGDGRRVNQ